MSTGLSFTDSKWTKTCLIMGGCAAVGLSAYAVYAYYQNKRRMVDEGFEDIPVVDDHIKKVLVLGLDGAGKSTFLSRLMCIDENPSLPNDTTGVVTVHCKSGKILNFAEIAGSESMRVYWSNFVQDTDLLIYIVDSSDEHRLAESVKELRILTACDKLSTMPIVILANKQDLANAASPENIGAAFGIRELSKQNKIAVFPLEMPPGETGTNESVLRIKKVVTQLCFRK